MVLSARAKYILNYNAAVGGVSTPAACESVSQPRHAYTWEAKKKETLPPSRALHPSCFLSLALSLF